MFQKSTPELRKKIEESGLPLVRMTLEEFKASLGKKSNKKPKINK
jgi:tripartite-type tricarboxylate transporter receptor subunit TctC